MSKIVDEKDGRLTPEQRAEACVALNPNSTDNDSMLMPVDILERIASAIREAVAAAIVQERERCARVAESDSVLEMIGGSTGNAKGTALRIARVIREGDESRIHSNENIRVSPFYR